MPHVGGGSGGGGGGFHSSSSGTSSSTPRYDHNGNLHSKYYVRPGFYYSGIYVPYERKGRGIKVILPYILFILVGAFIGFLGVNMIFTQGSYDGDKLQEFALNKYSEIYEPSNGYYESNILVTIVAYESNDQYDYISIVGDDLNTFVDCAFGNQTTLFGSQVEKNVSYTNYYSSLYTNLAKSVEAIIDEMPDHCCYDNTLSSKIVNETKFGDIQGEEELKSAENKFYEKTGYHISFLIADAKNVYKLDVTACLLLSGVGLLFVTVAGYGMYRGLKAVKEVNNAIKRDEGKIYFEGEDDFDTYNSQFPYKKF